VSEEPGGHRATAGQSGSAWSLRNRHDREIAALAVPALGTLIADPLLSLVDTAFVGRLGTDELGALGVASAVFAVAFFVFNFLEYGTTSVVARAVGAEDRGRAGGVLVIAFGLALTVGVVVTAVLEVAKGPIVGVMGGSGGVRSAAITYVAIRALAAPALLVVRAAHGAYRGHHDTRTPFKVTLGINGINLALDPLLIFGLGWGIAGAAWATVIAQWAGALWFGALAAGRHRKLLALDTAQPRRADLRAFLVIGRDLAIRTGSLLAALTLASAVAARVSETAIAAHQVVFQIWVFLALALDALAIAAQAMVGRRVGAEEREVARRVSDRLAVLGVAVGVVLGLILAALFRVMPGWFSGEAEVVATAQSVWWFLVFTQPAAGLVFVWDGVFLGAGDFLFLALAMLGSAVLAAVVILLVLPLGLGLPGVWWGIVTLMAARTITLAWRRAGPGSPLRSRRPR
jgi:MATE family multidrug resistance protein